MLAFFTQGELLLTLEGQDGRLLARWAPSAPGVRLRSASPSQSRPKRTPQSATKTSGDGDPLSAVPSLKEAVASWDEVVRKAVRGFDGLSPAEAEQL